MLKLLKLFITLGVFVISAVFAFGGLVSLALTIMYGDLNDN